MTAGNPILSMTAKACFSEKAMPFAGCKRFKSSEIFLNFSLSSAASIESFDVPRIGILILFKNDASLRGVWPPNCTMTPSNLPLVFSFNIMSYTFSSASGSKYSRSLVSGSVETVSGLQFIMIVSYLSSLSANEA